MIKNKISSNASHLNGVNDFLIKLFAICYQWLLSHSFSILFLFQLNKNIVMIKALNHMHTVRVKKYFINESFYYIRFNRVSVEKLIDKILRFPRPRLLQYQILQSMTVVEKLVLLLLQHNFYSCRFKEKIVVLAEHINSYNVSKFNEYDNNYWMKFEENVIHVCKYYSNNI